MRGQIRFANVSVTFTAPASGGERKRSLGGGGKTVQREHQCEVVWLRLQRSLRTRRRVSTTWRRRSNGGGDECEIFRFDQHRWRGGRTSLRAPVLRKARPSTQPMGQPCKQTVTDSGGNLVSRSDGGHSPLRPGGPSGTFTGRPSRTVNVNYRGERHRYRSHVHGRRRDGRFPSPLRRQLLGVATPAELLAGPTTAGTPASITATAGNTAERDDQMLRLRPTLQATVMDASSNPVRRARW